MTESEKLVAQYQSDATIVNECEIHYPWSSSMFFPFGRIVVNRAEQKHGRGMADFTDDTGLIVCGKCGKHKQLRLVFTDKTVVVPCACDCEQAEYECQKKRRVLEQRDRKIQKLRDASLLMEQYDDVSFDGFLKLEQNEDVYDIGMNYAENFKEMYKAGQGLLFYGPVGTGKSFTAACIANALLKDGWFVVMTSFVKLLKNAAKFEKDESSLQRAIDSASLVILDDFGAERDTSFATERVYEVINDRVNSKKPMVVTTNMPLEDLQSPNSSEEGRIYDRILGSCFPVQFRGVSMREIKAQAMNNVTNILTKKRQNR